MGSSKLLVLCLFAARLAYSQAVRGSLLGTVMDSSGGVIANAQVALKEMDTGIVRNGQTGEAGNYVFVNLPQGRYAVTVEAKGFKKPVRQNIDVLVNTSVRGDMSLQPAAITEVVNVFAETPLLQTDRADVSRQVEETTLANLPLSTPGGRNFQALI